MKKKLLIIHRNQFGYQAGYYYYCKYLKNDFDITFACQDSGLKRIGIDGVEIKYIRLEGNKYTNYFNWLKSLVQIIRKNKFDLIFTAFLKFVFVLPILFPSKKIILDIRTGSLNRGKLKNYFQNRAIQLQASFFKHKTILSEGLITRLKVKNSHIVPLGADRISDTDKNFDKFNLLYVGTFRGRDFHQTIEGLHLFLKDNTSVRKNLNYDIIGFGIPEEEAEMIESIKKYNLTDVVTFHGRKNHQELNSFFDNCNIGICWVPMTDYFNFQPPTKIFEYVLSGMICVATNTYENSKLINTDNGVLCDDSPQSFAKALASIPQKSKGFTSGDIRASLADYSWKNIVENNLLVYLKNISRK